MKAGLGVGGDAIGDGYGNDDPLEAGFRFDLDDVNGEVVQLRWGDETKTGEPKTAGGEPMTAVMRYGGTGRGVLRAAHFIEGRNGSSLPFMARMLRLGGNPYVEPIPALGGKDAVGRDIADIPAVLGRIQDDWNEPAESMNRLTAYTLGVRLRQRMVAHAEGTHDGSVDLLICGCEVSLWVGEQFASDLHNAFPQLKVVTLSSNKILAQLGQAFPQPQTGFCFNETSYKLANSPVMLITHSGGTFATLNIANLLGVHQTYLLRDLRVGHPGGARRHAGPPGKVKQSFDLVVCVHHALRLPPRRAVLALGGGDAPAPHQRAALPDVLDAVLPRR